MAFTSSGNFVRSVAPSKQRFFELLLTDIHGWTPTVVVLTIRDQEALCAMIAGILPTEHDLVLIPPSANGVATSLLEGGDAGLLISDLEEETAPGYYGELSLHKKPGQPPCPQGRVSLLTSGSTGEPKLTPVEKEVLGASFDSSVARTGSGRNRWYTFYDLYRFAGLQVLLRCLSRQEYFLAPRNDGDLVTALEMMHSNGVNAIAATPSMFRRLASDDGFARLDIRHLALGGEAPDESLMSRLRRLFPEARINHTYATTELGVVFSVKDGHAGFPVSYLDDDSGYEIRLSEEGELEVLRSGSWMATGDMIEIRQERCFFSGRLGNVINVGGYNVQKEEVEAVVLEVKEVEAALVKKLKSSLLGQLVGVDVVLVPGVGAELKALKRKILDHCRGRLQNYKVPAVLQFVEHIELNENGKIKRT